MDGDTLRAHLGPTRRRRSPARRREPDRGGGRGARTVRSGARLSDDDPGRQRAAGRAHRRVIGSRPARAAGKAGSGPVLSRGTSFDGTLEATGIRSVCGDSPWHMRWDIVDPAPVGAPEEPSDASGNQDDFPIDSPSCGRRRMAERPGDEAEPLAPLRSLHFCRIFKVLRRIYVSRPGGGSGRARESVEHRVAGYGGGGIHLEVRPKQFRPPWSVSFIQMKIS